MFGPIMAAPLAMPVICISRPAMVTLRPASLWTVSVVNMPRAAATSEASLRPSFTAAAAMPCVDLVHRQERPDHAGREHQGLVRLRPAGGGGQPGHLLGVAQPALAGAGVGHARADRHGADPVAGRAAAVQGHRGGKHQVLRIHARRVAGVSDITSERSCFCGSRLIRQWTPASK